MTEVLCEVDDFHGIKVCPKARLGQATSGKTDVILAIDTGDSADPIRPRCPGRTESFQRELQRGNAIVPARSPRPRTHPTHRPAERNAHAQHGRSFDREVIAIDLNGEQC